MGRTDQADPTHPSDASHLEEIEPEVTSLRGVRTHNLKDIDVDIPRGQFIAVSGVSGSGKSSLAFDTLYAEGQRRYTESLSTYARQFLRRMERPPADAVENIQPAVALKQKNEVSNARSTVGTVTEVDDHLQLVYTHIGRTFCPDCQSEVRRDTPTAVAKTLGDLDEGTRLIVVADVEAEEEGHRPAILEQLVQEGYRRLYIDGETVDITESDFDSLLERSVFPVVVDRLVVREGEEMRLTEAVEAGFQLSNGQIEVHFYDGGREPLTFDRKYRCNHCGRRFIEPRPVLFSFNSEMGACDRCNGYGKVMGIDFSKVIPNRTQTLEEGAVAAFEGKKYSKYKKKMLSACRRKGIPINIPYERLDEDQRLYIEEGGEGWQGVRGFFDDLQGQRHKTYVRIFLARYRGYDRCPDCGGARLGPEARNVKVDGRSISDFWQMRIEEAREYFDDIELPEEDADKVEPLIAEIRHRLRYLDTIGLGYMSLGRQSRTLSGGEMQRIHLTASLGRALTDTLYVLDEPTAGMHAVDTDRLLKVIEHLRDLGNTVVVVEHDPDVIEAADFVIELGPYGGEQGGDILFAGDQEAFRAQTDTLTGRALEGRRDMHPEPITDQPDGWVEIAGATEYNLADIDVRFPYGRLSVVTGVSGSGKSTLCERVLFNGWKQQQGEGGVDAGAFRELSGLDGFEDVVMMDQSAIGRSTRSNSLTYTGAYDDIRKLYSKTQAANLAGLTMGDFSFNTPGGRCEECEGTGVTTLEMHFMADIDIPCDECDGKRFNDRVLGAEYRGKNVADVFEMTVDEATEFFAEKEPIVRKLKPLREVGLGYLRVGQTTATLSGGEAQRLKLASYIAEGRKRGGTESSLFIFDEPTVGLHLFDVDTLVEALRKLVALGHTVICIEHDIDFIAQCDYVVDLGPGAGPRGGEVVATGSPYEIAEVSESRTGEHLQKLLSGGG